MAGTAANANESAQTVTAALTADVNPPRTRAGSFPWGAGMPARLDKAHVSCLPIVFGGVA